MNIIKEIAKYIVGGLFIFSGLIKINDPVGTAIKLEEYFEVFASDFGSFFHLFVPYALPIGVFLVVLEVVLGIAILINYRANITIWVLLLLIVFFTFLTFYSAVFEVVRDCGCFGDAIKLDPWESFYKDIFLLILIAILFFKRKAFSPIISQKISDIVVGALTIFWTFIAIYAIQHLPYIDFRAYKIGANIEEEMMFTNPNELPKITDYAIWNDEDDFTEASFVGSRLFILIYSTEKANEAHIEDIKTLLDQISNYQIEPWILTSSTYDQFEEFRHKHQLAIPFYYADATVLKTMIRSNPGIMLLKNGTILGKWHHNDVPTSSDLLKVL